MGETGSPYDSKEYREMTDAILLQEEIDVIIKSTKSLNALFDIAMSLSYGDGTIRDVPAARQIMEFVKFNAMGNDISLYIDVTRGLAEDYALPISDSNLEYAIKLFSEVFNICLEKSWVELGIKKDMHQMHEWWSMIGLAYCYEKQGLCEEAEKTYNKFKNKSKHTPERLDIAVEFAKLLNRARAIDPTPKTLLIFADEFDKLADYDRKQSNVKHNNLIEKCVVTAKHLRKRARKLEERRGKCNA